ncbi:cysteine-rich receptor-like protein kinase [Trifolium medium]|uniref:Cysteine-rich receptor-like protein kinase n=1 Tax=Trifolium medium TaxID=97028 RepID=A0A392MMG0_9FABA|nr:cysteine-rich receptor-like protein kinase [Trifolium medium]
MRCKESQLFQRSKSRWLREGDANTNYFHASVKSRGRKNAILALKVGDRWVESVSEGLSSQEVVGLTTPFSAKEIKDVVVSYDYDGNKSPGPGGFNFVFFKRFWDLLKSEVGIMFDQSFVTADFPRNFSYFITLIPKIDAPRKIGDFMPISLVGSLYKLVSKVLAKVMPKLISPNQLAFIKDRQLVDGVVAVNELELPRLYDDEIWVFLEMGDGPNSSLQNRLVR